MKCVQSTSSGGHEFHLKKTTITSLPPLHPNPPLPGRIFLAATLALSVMSSPEGSRAGSAPGVGLESIGRRVACKGGGGVEIVRLATSRRSSHQLRGWEMIHNVDKVPPHHEFGRWLIDKP